MKSNHKTLALLLVFILLFAALFKFTDPGRRDRVSISYSQFFEYAQSNQLETVTVKVDEKQYFAQLKPEAVKEGKALIRADGPIDDEKLRDLLRQNKVETQYENPEKTPVWQQILVSWLPMIFLILIFVFIMRQLQAGGGKAMSFGKSKARLMTEETKKITFKDVAGAEEAKEELEEIIDFLKDPKRFSRLGGKIPKGVLLMGPPGTGKTLLAKAVAGEAGAPFFSISGSDFVEMFVGVGASRVRDLFEQGKKNAPCIIFIDEIDAVGRHRGAGLGGGHDEREQTLNQLLVEMDGFESNEGVILIAATNRPDVLDPALLRPGRFDRRVTVSNPDVRGREQILNVHTRKVPISEDVQLDVIARGTPGFSGADLANLVNEAALLAARSDKKYVEMHDFEEAKDKVLMGAARKSMIITDEDKKVTAYHEAGHTLVGVSLPGLDPIHKVTIVPRGRALGLTQTLPTEDVLNMEKNKAENLISFLMGGRIAEELKFNQKTTGAGNDIERATDIARRMVCEWGMSEKLGPLSYGQKDEAIFLGREIQQHRDFSEETAQAIDREIRDIVQRNYDRAKEILTQKQDVLERLSLALLEYETLDGEEVNQIIAGKTIDRKPPEKPTATAKDKGVSAKKKKSDSEGGASPAPLPA